MKIWKPTDKTALVTHKGCLDGTGSALMFIWAGGLRKNIFFRNPSFCFLTKQEAEPFDEVWFADMCPASLDDPAGGKSFHVFDHHLSNQKKFCNHPNCTFDMGKSGTSLMAEQLDTFCQEEDSYENILIKAIESYDLGKFDCEEGMRLADIASTYSQDEMLDIMSGFGAEGVLYNVGLDHRAAAASISRIQYAEQAAKNAYGFMFPEDMGTSCGVAVSPVYWKNEVAQRILKDYDIAMIIDPTSQMISLRSKEGGPDCSIIAARYGGGGHARAAGFKANGRQMLAAIVEAVIG